MMKVPVAYQRFKNLFINGVCKGDFAFGKALFFLISMFCGKVNSISQSCPYPAKFYTLQSDNEKAIFLRKVIGDSVHEGQYKCVPSWCHNALSFAAKYQNDTISPWLYQFLGDAYETTKFDSAAYYYSRSLFTFKNISPAKNQYLYQSILYAYMQLNKPDSIRKYTVALDKMANALPDNDKKKLTIINTVAQGYNTLSQYEKTIQAYRYVIKQSAVYKDSATMLNALVNMGAVYTEMDDYRMAIYYTLQALPYLRNKEYAKLVVHNNLAQYYQTLNNTDSAKIFLKTAEVLARKLNDPDAINSVAMTRATVLMADKKYGAAEQIIQQCLTYFQKNDADVDLVNCLLIYASLDTLQNNFPKAETHMRMLNDITKNMAKVFKMEALRMLAIVNEHMADYKDAYFFQKEFIALNDSVKSEKAIKSLAELQTEYQTFKKEEEIRSLQKAALIKNLELKAALRNKTFYGILIFVLIGLFALVWYIRQLRNKTAMQNLKADLEMKALRSQMNPHFIFNSLNSIQKYIWENRQEDASEYLTKFARLIRLVLENSLHPSIKLNDELNALRIYIEMEHRRNNQKFDYSITVADDVDAANIFIPPLLLQPYIENAIWHGLSQKDERGKLSVEIKRTKNSLVCIIDDNGIGRLRSSEIKTDNPPKTSLAMNISSQRIDWLKKEAGLEASINITDKYSGYIAEGTTVLLTLPLTLKHD